MEKNQLCLTRVSPKKMITRENNYFFYKELRANGYVSTIFY